MLNTNYPLFPLLLLRPSLSSLLQIITILNSETELNAQVQELERQSTVAARVVTMTISIFLLAGSLLWLVGSLKRSRSMILTAMISWRVQFLAVLAINSYIFLQLRLIRRVMDKSRVEGVTAADLREWEAYIDRLDEPWMQKCLPVYLTLLSQGFVL